MKKLPTRLLLAPIVLAASLVLPASADVHFVRADGTGDFTDLQAAVDAAQEGDVLLVGRGSYAGFVVDGKGLWITAGFGQRPEILGTVEVRGVPAGSKLVLAGLDGHPPAPVTSSGLAPELGLWVHDNAGHVRVQDCTFEGARGGAYHWNWRGATGGLFQANLSLVVDGCTLRGGLGGAPDSDTYFAYGEAGGDGAIFETSLAAAYGSTFEGGAGARIHIGAPAGDGGSGCIVPSYGLFAAGSTFVGGNGGGNDDFLGSGEGGQGGHGLVVLQGAQGQLLDNVYQGGAGGSSFLGSPGWPGTGLIGAGVMSMIGGAARLVSGPNIALDADPIGAEVVFTLTGAPGDEVWLASSHKTNFRFAPPLKGVWLVPRLVLLPITPIATIPASGTIDVQIPVADLPAWSEAVGWLMQVVVRTAKGQFLLGAPQAVLVANCEGLTPDCNGSGQWDVCDVLRGTSTDCDGNFVPDECEPDCNGNGIADACDIVGGAPDLNGNGVPDECEPVNATWYVDPSATPGGNGSSLSPFRTIREAVDSALSGHVILLRGGLYTGPDNRGFDLSNRILTVRSVNDATTCIIDLQGQGRAFDFVSSPGNQATLIRGLTFRNGQEFVGGAIYISSSSPTILNCAFESCSAAYGGAIYAGASSSRIAGCTFRSCSAPGGEGGALFADNSASYDLRVWRCTFEGNSAFTGGAVRAGSLNPSWPVRISHSLFLGNTATTSGGGMHCPQARFASVESCLFDGNAAATGGAVGVWGAVELSSCTLVAGSASSAGGALCLNFALAPQQASSLRGSVVRGSSAPSGAQIALLGNNSPLTVEFCDVQGGQAGVALGGTAMLTWGAGNLDLDPLFVDPDGPDDDPATYADNDWRLGAGSPCVDAGSNALVPPDHHDLDGDLDTLEPVPFDLLGQARFVDDPAVPDTGSGAPPLVDLGAFERQP